MLHICVHDHDSDSGMILYSRSEKNSRDSSVCKYDSCSAEVFYPVKDGPEYTSSSKTVAWVLFILLLLLATLAVIQPCRA